MNSNQPNPNDRNTLSETDERAIDALIYEVNKLAPSPPDLSTAILSELARTRWEGPSAAFNREKDSRGASSVATKRGRSWFAVATGVLALAASIFLILSRWDRTVIDPTRVAENNTTEGLDEPEIAVDKSQVASPTVIATAPTGVVKPTTPREGVPLVRNKPTTTKEQIVDPVLASTEQPSSVKKLTSNHAQSLAEFNGEIESYWERVGVVTAAPIDDAELAARIEDRFGARPDLSNGETLVQATLVNAAACEPLATRLVNRLFRGVPLVPDAQERMIAEATAVIVQGDRFDALISRWVADDSLFNHDRPEQLSQGLATNLLDADAACARCHDSPVDGRFGQEDYWSIASLFAPANRPALFYEMSDGRQRVAEARIPRRWLGNATPSQEASSQEAPVDRQASQKEQLAKQLVGNRILAGALANRIWEIGFGAPLISRASDPIAPPRDDALQQSHTALTDAIINSNFDVRFVVRLVMASDPMRRGQSELYASGRWRVANEETILRDSLAHRTFAAAPIRRPRMGRDQLLAMMGSRIGQAPQSLGASSTVLAQPSVGDGDKNGGSKFDAVVPEKPRDEEFLWAAWVADRKLLEDSWLHWIKDPEEQKRHAFYAVNKTPANREDDFASQLVSRTDDESVAVQNANDRLFWILRQSL